MTNIATAAKALEASAQEAIDNGAAVDCGHLNVGEGFAQGDVAMVLLAAVPTGATPTTRPDNGQVAPGTSKGSRHLIEDVDAKFFTVNDGNPLSDLVVSCERSFVLSHPEHANVTFDPGTYRVVHQQNEARERVRD